MGKNVRQPVDATANHHSVLTILRLILMCQSEFLEDDLSLITIKYFIFIKYFIIEVDNYKMRKKCCATYGGKIKLL